MKRLLVLLSTILFFVACNSTVKEEAKKSITIKGHVQFNDPKFKMEIIKVEGFDSKTIGEFDINPDGSYEYQMVVEKPGIYYLNCKKWQTVGFWAEDENIEVNFRGADTAKMKIKNPPYTYIKGGALNEVINLMNYADFRNYQLMIQFSQAVYRMKELTDAQKQEFSGSMYDILDEDYRERMRYIAETYGDRNSVLAILKRLEGDKHKELVEKVVTRLETINPNYQPLLDYKEAIAEAKYQKERLAIGKPAPDFSFPTPDGNVVGLKDYRGKLLIVDFWASWCGPCRSEIPHMKEIYKKYKSQGVEILSVSIDKKDTDWTKALQEEDMPWAQVCAPNAGAEIMKDYQFNGIPYIILIDKEGNILAKNLRGEDINKAIDEALKSI